MRRTERRCSLTVPARSAKRTLSANSHIPTIRHLVEFNFIEDPDLTRMFGKPRKADDILMRMELASDEPMQPGNTLVFLDEIQQCKEVATAIKFLVDDGRYDFILSGSLLGVELEDIRSVPTGYLTEIRMFPLTSRSSAGRRESARMYSPCCGTTSSDGSLWTSSFTTV